MQSPLYAFLIKDNYENALSHLQMLLNKYQVKPHSVFLVETRSTQGENVLLFLNNHDLGEEYQNRYPKGDYCDELRIEVAVLKYYGNASYSKSFGNKDIATYATVN